MKTTTIAALIAGLIFVAAASAQEYSIRANRGLNLRAEPSLNADIAGTVRAGAILQVVGESGRWLSVNWPGSNVWLANWVSFSRVDTRSQPPTQTGTSGPIDNCCFVDRQCSSDLDWIGGYHGLSKWTMRCPATITIGNIHPEQRATRPVKLTTAALPAGNAITTRIG